MTKIWQKSKSKSNSIIESYNTGDDYLWDLEIFSFDVQASIAYTEMPGIIGVTSHPFLKSG